MSGVLKAPFPWFGGKALVAPVVWQAFGDVANYVEPFAGSLAVLLGRPPHHNIRTETVNDKDGYICNAWRAIQLVPDEVAFHADWPINECDLHARHLWLTKQREQLADRLMGDPDYYDAKVAGYWLWGISMWIGAGFCSGKGPWTSVDGKMVKAEEGMVWKKRPHLVGPGSGEKGVSKGLFHLGNHGKGVHRQYQSLYTYMEALSTRLRRVRVTCGDWTRIMGPAVTQKDMINAIFLDPPYSSERSQLYHHDSYDISHDVRQWATRHGDNPKLRIALCGYDGEHEMPSDWREIAWKTQGGYGNRSDSQGRENASKERIWFSPHCLTDHQMEMFT